MNEWMNEDKIRNLESKEQARISMWRKSYFVQSQNTTKHKTKFITILQQHVSA